MTVSDGRVLAAVVVEIAVRGAGGGVLLPLLGGGLADAAAF